jgi:hypothetical protein
MVEGLGDIVETLKEADPAIKADVYRDLGIKLTYHPEGTVQATARPRVYSGACRRGTYLQLPGRPPCPIEAGHRRSLFRCPRIVPHPQWGTGARVSISGGDRAAVPACIA